MTNRDSIAPSRGILLGLAAGAGFWGLLILTAAGLAVGAP